MRRKKKSGTGGRQEEAIIVPATERLRRDGLERIAPLPDANGAVGRPWKSPDTLARMLRAGSITRGMQAAGLKFSRTFYLAGLDPLWAADLGRVPVLAHSGRAGSGPPGTAALEQVLSALDALGGIQSPSGSCAWHVLGCEWTLEAWCQARVWGLRRIRPEIGTGILLADLGILKSYYNTRRGA